MSSGGEKRKYIETPLYVKLRALNEIKNGSSVNDIAKDLQVHSRTVQKWIKNEAKLREWEHEHTVTISKDRKRLKNPYNQRVDSATWIWFQEKRDLGLSVDGSLVRTQAHKFWESLGGTQEFDASPGWLAKWKKRHGIECVSISGEKLSADSGGAEDYKKKFKNYISEEQLSPHQIFNCDETGLNFKQMPKKTLNTVSCASGLKVQEERLTLLVCSNASGTIKLPLVVVGKSAKPRALKNDANSPVSYKNQGSAWMTGKLFEDWFKNEFCPFVKIYLRVMGLPLKAVLFIDNCASHPQELESDFITVKFLPPNTTSLIQPMEQGCLKQLKMLYRRQLMVHLLGAVNKGLKLSESLKTVTIEEVIFWTAKAWQELPISTIIKSWKPLWPEIMDTAEIGRVMMLTRLAKNGTTSTVGDQTEGFGVINTDRTDDLSNQFLIALQNDNEDSRELEICDMYSWLNPGHSMTADECLTPEEIIDVINEEERQKENNQNENSEKVSLDEALFHIDKVVKFCGSNQSFQKHLQELQSIQDIMRFQAGQSHSSVISQKQSNDYYIEDVLTYCNGGGEL